MSEPLDHATRNILYHALGANVEDGLAQLDRAFRGAEADYRLDDLNVLLGVISDPTLQDQRLASWRAYYGARLAFLRYRLDEAEQILDRIPVNKGLDRPPLSLYVDLLRGQIMLRRGDWSASRRTLDRVIGQAGAAEDTLLRVDAYQALAQGYISQAHSMGGWVHPEDGQAARLVRGILSIALLPLYAPLFLYLWISGTQAFCRPAWRFGADYSNWPVFGHYLKAYRVLTEAERLLDPANGGRRHQLEMLRAGLLRDVTAYRAAVIAYAGLAERQARTQDAYQAALIDHGLAKTLLEINDPRPMNEIVGMLEGARQTYVDAEDHRSVAYVDLLLGDADLERGDAASAIHRWEGALHTLQEECDVIGVAEGLGRCYAVQEKDPPLSARQTLWDLVRSVETQVFVVRLPNRLFRIIQVLGWSMPLVIALAVILSITVYLQNTLRDEQAGLVSALFSWRGALLLAGALVASMMANTLLGLAGLLASSWVSATRLDLIELDAQGLSCFDPTGRDRLHMPWTSVQLFLRVERALWSRPTGLLSFDYLRGDDGKVLRLPGTASWFQHLRHSVEDHLGPPSCTYRLRWYGGAILWYLVLVYILSFMLNECALSRWLSAVGHARLAAVFVAVSYTVITYVAGRWLVHYIQVGGWLLPLIPFAIGTSLLGAALVALGTVGRQLVAPTHSVVVTWGTALLVALVAYLGKRSETARQLILSGMGQGVILVIGVSFVVHTLLPVLYHTQAYTYTGVLLRQTRGEPTCVDTRAELFDRLREAGAGMVRWDRSYAQGYSALGHAAYFARDYQISIDDYTRSIEIGEWVELYYCRALAYQALGQVENAERDLRTYQQRRETDNEPYCQTLFPEAKDILPVSGRRRAWAKTQTEVPKPGF